MEVDEGLPLNDAVGVVDEVALIDAVDVDVDVDVTVDVGVSLRDAVVVVDGVLLLLTLGVIELDAHTASSVALHAIEIPSPTHWLQLEHAVAPTDVANLPAAQASQAVELAAALKVPAGHEVHNDTPE